MANDVPVNPSTAFVVVDVVTDGQVNFDFNFRADEVDDLSVIWRQAGGVSLELQPGIDFQLPEPGLENGGTIVLSGSPETKVGETFIIYREMLIERTHDWQRDLFAWQLNDEADDIYMILQQLNRDIGRAIKVPVGSPGYTISADLQDGSVLLVSGGGIVSGLIANEIANAQGYALNAQQAYLDALGIVGSLGSLAQAVADSEANADRAEDAADALDAAVSAFVIGGYGLVIPQLRTWLSYLFANGLTEPRRLLTNSLDDFVGTLIDGDAWGHIIALNLCFLHDDAVSLLNLKNPTTFPLIKGGGITHSPGFGYVGDAAAKYLSYADSPATVAGWTRYAGGVGMLITGATTTSNKIATLAGAATPGFGMTPVGTSGGGSQFNVRFNNTTLVGFAGGTQDGFAAMVRESDNSLKAYKDGVLVGTSAQVTQVAPSASPITILRSGTAYEDGTVHAVTLLAGTMNEARMAVLSSALADLRNRIGGF